TADLPRTVDASTDRPTGYYQIGRAAGPDRSPLSTSHAHRDWGFVLAAPRRLPGGPRLDPSGPRTRTLTDASLAADARAAEETRVRGLPASTLIHPRYTG
ncbi:spermidine synthase, partial [Streptomyces sp. NPDC004976]